MYPFNTTFFPVSVTYHFQAPGEAEAELAMMSYRHFIDLVVTEDSDALVFGAQRIARK